MRAQPLTLLVMVPGRTTWRIELSSGWPSVLMALMLLPFAAGATAQRCLNVRGVSQVLALRAADITGSLQDIRPAERESEEPRVALSAVSAPVDHSALHRDVPAPGSVIDARQVQRASPSQPKLAAVDRERADELAKGWLRLQALHLGEVIRVRPFDDAGQPDPQAFDAVSHLMRCRITGEEVAIDPRLVRILVQISTTYGREVELVSGHRKPYAIGTSPTSQHAFGRAADIRVAGVGIEELRRLAISLGARGVGLYPEKGFVHVDVRDKAKYFWVYSDDEGEEADARPARASAPPAERVL